VTVAKAVIPSLIRLHRQAGFYLKAKKKGLDKEILGMVLRLLLGRATKFLLEVSHQKLIFASPAANRKAPQH
jgi:hypothetical protein